MGLPLGGDDLTWFLEPVVGAASGEKAPREDDRLPTVSHRHLTDLELSGAVAECRRAQRARDGPPRPLERLVIPTGHKRSGAR